MRLPNKTRDSPKALIKFRRRNVGRGKHGFEATEAGQGKFVLQAPASLEMVRSLRDALSHVARDAITAEGEALPVAMPRERSPFCRLALQLLLLLSGMRSASVQGRKAVAQS